MMFTNVAGKERVFCDVQAVQASGIPLTPDIFASVNAKVGPALPPASAAGLPYASVPAAFATTYATMPLVAGKETEYERVYREFQAVQASGNPFPTTPDIPASVSAEVGPTFALVAAHDTMTSVATPRCEPDKVADPAPASAGSTGIAAVPNPWMEIFQSARLAEAEGLAAKGPGMWFCPFCEKGRRGWSGIGARKLREARTS